MTPLSGAEKESDCFFFLVTLSRAEHVFVKDAKKFTRLTDTKRDYVFFWRRLFFTVNW